MRNDEIDELGRLAAAYAIERVQPFEDVTGLASALVRRYLLTFEDSLDDYQASWDASREDPNGCTWPAWLRGYVAGVATAAQYALEGEREAE